MQSRGSVDVADAQSKTHSPVQPQDDASIVNDLGLACV